MKGLVSVLLLPLLGGAIFCWTYVGTRYRFTRRSGYHFFFMAAIAGGTLLAGIYLPLRVLEIAVPRAELVFGGWDRFAPPVPYLGTCVASLLIAWPAARLLNRYTNSAKVRQEEIELIMLSRYEPELRSFFPDGPQMS